MCCESCYESDYESAIEMSSDDEYFDVPDYSSCEDELEAFQHAVMYRIEIYCESHKLHDLSYFMEFLRQHISDIVRGILSGNHFHMSFKGSDIEKLYAIYAHDYVYQIYMELFHDFTQEEVHSIFTEDMLPMLMAN